MNIWSLDKDASVKHLLLLLAQVFQDEDYKIIDSELDDKQAVRLANPRATNAQLYIFTYGQDEGRYGVHIEYPDIKETQYRDTLEIHDNISFDQLVSIITINLEVPVIGMTGQP